MAKKSVGSRVGAIRDADKEEVRLFGYGVYEGDEIPPFPLVMFGITIPPRPNPKIKLDSGDVVWGCQCWWGPEDEVKESVAGRRVVVVPVPESKAASS